MPNPLDMVTEDQREQPGPARVFIYPSGDRLTGTEAVTPSDASGNALTQAVAPEQKPFDLMQGLAQLAELVKHYGAGILDQTGVAGMEPGPKRDAAVTGRNSLVGVGDDQNLLWPQRMVKSGATLPGEVAQGIVPVVDPNTGRTSVPMIERAQDTAGLMGGGALTERPGGATLGSGPVRRGMATRIEQNQIKDLIQSAKDRNVELDASYDGFGDAYSLHWIESKGNKTAPREGTKVIRELSDLADKNNKGIDLVAMADDGPGGQYLPEYYKALGFELTGEMTPDGPVMFRPPGAKISEKMATKLFSDTQKPGAAIAGAASSSPAPVFYSALEHAATNAAQDVMSPQQWLGFLKNTPGVKAEELAWTGIGDWLATQKGKVKKEDVQRYLDEHKVEIKDVTKSKDGTLTEEQIHRATMDDVARDNPHLERGSDEFMDLVDERYATMEDDLRGPDGTKYSSYQLPGGENYREHLLTLPQKVAKTDPEAMTKLGETNRAHAKFSGEMATKYGNGWRSKIAGEDAIKLQQLESDMQKYRDASGSAEQVRLDDTANYQSSHWDEPNVLAHVRTNDRTMARELSPEHVAVNEARAKVQAEIEAVRAGQAAVANEINAVVRPLEKARQDQIRADIKAKKISGAEGLKKLEEYYEHPEIKPLQDKLEQLRAKETTLSNSIHDIVPKTMTDEQALAAAKDWVNEGNPDSQKWDKTPPERQKAWVAQMHKVAGRRAMNEAEKPVKSLHIEEIQSDWHQQGRKQGYTDLEAVKTAEKAAVDTKDALTAHLEKNHPGVSERIRQNIVAQLRSEANSNYPSGRTTLLDQLERGYGKEARDLGEQVIDAHRAATEIKSGSTVPDAPFKTTWPELALKRMIRHAAEQGYDRISWTPGEAQAARYDLSKTISKVHYMPDLQGGTLAAEGLRPGQTVLDKSGVKPEQIADYIGKDAAEKLLKAAKDKDGIHTLEGLDLKVGGEGMREFYDKMLPKMAEKIGKAHGVKVKTTQVETARGFPAKLAVYDKDGNHVRDFTNMADARAYLGNPDNGIPGGSIKGGKAVPPKTEPVHYFDLPPSLKEHAVGKGFPLYMSGIPFPLTPVDYDPFKEGK